MSKDNIAKLVLIIAFTLMIAYFVGQAVLGGRTSKAVDVETAQPISADIVKPEEKIFNENAINPTVEITIGENNQNPIGN